MSSPARLQWPAAATAVPGLGLALLWRTQTRWTNIISPDLLPLRKICRGPASKLLPWVSWLYLSLTREKSIRSRLLKVPGPKMTRHISCQCPGGLAGPLQWWGLAWSNGIKMAINTLWGQNPEISKICLCLSFWLLKIFNSISPPKKSFLRNISSLGFLSPCVHT